MSSYDSTLAYLYGRYDFARQSMKNESLTTVTRRDWAMRAEELRQCLRQLERWRTNAVGSRYQPEIVTAEEICPPQPAACESAGDTQPIMPVSHPVSPSRPAVQAGHPQPVRAT